MLLDGENSNKHRTKPYVRWWWLSGPFTESDITRQLHWIQINGFGGVELAWIDPSWLDEPDRSAPRPAFLSGEWARLVTFAKREADRLGLGCDFTFGSAWPFGGSWLRAEDAAQTFGGLSGQRLTGSWESGVREPIYVLDHLSASALARYAQPLLAALAPALAVPSSSLFCDSLEIATAQLWSPLLWDEFAERFGYRLEPFVNALDEQPDIRYDYRQLRGQAIVREFYQAFTALCHTNGARSRVQCHGAPADLLSAYASVDVPESEALLFPPPFSRIAASAAAWAGSNIVSAEAFTCLHGFPGWDDTADELWGEERTGDLKLLADALFANGVNQLVWHGMPYQPQGGQQEFYAAVHVGPDSPFAPSFPGLNAYLAQVCQALRSGETYARVGAYLPNEDAWMQDRIAADARSPGANFHWEMRHARQPAELRGYAPVWISHAFLKEAIYQSGLICSRRLKLDAIYIGSQWLDEESLLELSRLAHAGARIIWRSSPRQPGHCKSRTYLPRLTGTMQASAALPSVAPLLTGDNLPPYWARQVDGDLLLFFAHPLVDQIRYPMPHRLSEQATRQTLPVTIHWNNHQIFLPVQFEPNDGVLLAVSATGSVQPVALLRASDIGG